MLYICVLEAYFTSAVQSTGIVESGPFDTVGGHRAERCVGPVGQLDILSR